MKEPVDISEDAPGIGNDVGISEDAPGIGDDEGSAVGTGVASAGAQAVSVEAKARCCNRRLKSKTLPADAM